MPPTLGKEELAQELQELEDDISLTQANSLRFKKMVSATLFKE
ncbi:hypothetical protein [Helicobacter felis]|nr:hypothetical protein [Helicobacter felis]